MKIVLVYLTALILTFCTFGAYAETAVAGDAPVETVPVAEPAAPPEWAVNLMMTAQDIPVVGPVVSKVLLYLGIISSIVTAFIAFMLTTLTALSRIASLAGLLRIAQTLEVFKNSKIMYYMKFISLFNAKKVEPSLVGKPSESQKKAS